MTSALTSLAILKINADRRGHDPLDNFFPMVTDRLYHSDTPVVSLLDLRQAIGNEYGLWLPHGVLQTLTKRAARRKYLRREAGVLYVDRARLDDCDLSGVRADTARGHASIVRKGIVFARQQFGLHLTTESCEQAFDSFIMANSAPLLATVIDSKPLVAQPSVPVPDDLAIVIAAFVVDLAEDDPEGFRHLTDVVKGSVLAAALYFPSPDAFEQKLTKLTAYLDTTLLLRAVGACGPDLQVLAGEIIALGAAQGVHFRCFAHNLKEVRGVLDACMRAVKRRTGDYRGEATEYMVSAGWEESDVLLLSERLEAEFGTLGIRVVDKPEHEARFTIDEQRLESVLENEIRYHNPDARRKDVDSIAAIYLLRRGYETTSLARARAVFVTSNTALVRASRQYGRIEEGDRATVPPCIPDFLFTTMLWLMQPTVAPDLPTRSLIADSYAVMRADEQVWKQYVAKIEQLRASGAVNEDDYVLLRQSLSVRALILVDTARDPDAFTQGSVERVLQKAHENIAAAAMQDSAAARERETAARAELSRVSEQAAAQEEAHRLVAEARDKQMFESVQRLARRLTLTLLSIVAAVAVVGSIFSIPALAELAPRGALGFIVFGCTAVFAMFSIWSYLTERGLPSVARAVQQGIANVIYRWIRGSDVR